MGRQQKSRPGTEVRGSLWVVSLPRCPTLGRLAVPPASLERLRDRFLHYKSPRSANDTLDAAPTTM